jgi:TolB-like protein/lipoprotein NlpI
MVTGRVPFDGDTALSIAMRHKSETPKDPKEYNAQIPEDLNRMILKCLEKEKDKRCQSAGELRSELESIEKGVPTTDREIPKRKPITSKEITVTFGLRKLLVPALVFIGIVIAGLIIWQLLPQQESAPVQPENISIAILPFEDLSPEKKYEYLCDGIAETLINSLSPIKELKVPARTSAFSFKGKEQDIREIGQKLGVKNVLEGSVQVEGNKIRVTVRLSNAEDGFQLWSESYNRELEDIFSIQDDIAQTVVSTLKVQLLGEKKETIVKRHTESIEAYNLYLQGRFFWNKRTEDGMRRAIDKFEQALELEPNYALALVGISDCYNLLPIYGYSTPKEAFPKGKEAVMKALQIDYSLSEAHTSLAWIKFWYDWDWEGAEKEFKQAIELNPGYAAAHHWYSVYLYCMGRTDEAKKEIEIALELDPIQLMIKKDKSVIYRFNREYDKSIKNLLGIIDIEPNFPDFHMQLGWAYLLKAEYDKALNAFKKERIIQKGARIFFIDAWIGITYANMGKKEEARQLLNELIEFTKNEYIYPLVLATLSFDLGEDKLYKYWLDKVIEERDTSIAFSGKADPYFDYLRSDEAFIELLKKVNLLDE